MNDRNRQHPRLDKTLTIAYCVPDISHEWDMSVVKNISAGGIMFMAPGDMLLKDKRIKLKIGIPELAPHVLMLDAVVVDAKPCFNPKVSEVRAKFVNLTDLDKEKLSIIEKIKHIQDMKNSKK